MLNRSKFLIIGGTGFLGKEIINSLYNISKILDIEMHIEIISRNFDNFFSEDNNIKFTIKNNKSDIRWFIPYNNYYDYIIHMASETDSRDYSISGFDGLIRGTQRVALLVKKLQPKRFIYISSGSRNWLEPKNYTVGKRIGESISLNNFKDTIIICLYGLLIPYNKYEFKYVKYISYELFKRINCELPIMLYNHHVTRSYLSIYYFNSVIIGYLLRNNNYSKYFLCKSFVSNLARFSKCYAILFNSFNIIYIVKIPVHSQHHTHPVMFMHKDKFLTKSEPIFNNLINYLQ